MRSYIYTRAIQSFNDVLSNVASRIQKSDLRFVIVL
jgi:hypothetical protein